MKSYTVTNLCALTENALFLKKLLRDLYCVVKCNAYGHGDVECVSALRDVGMTRFAVFSFDEALRIKKAARDAEILILGRSDTAVSENICRYGFVQTVASSEYAEALANTTKCPKIHIKLDTGMNRSGFAAIPSLNGIKNKIIGAYTHFPNADAPDFSDTESRFLRFREAAGELQHKLNRPLTLHCAASAAALHKNAERISMSDVCRIGLALYGIKPAECAPDVRLTPVMSFYADVSEVRTVNAGERIGYGGKTLCAKKSQIATVSAGYANGLFRALFGRFRPIINGYRVPFAGNICMDRCMLDVTEIFECGGTVKSGDTVVFFDKNNPVTLISDAIGTISYEVLTSVGNLAAMKRFTSEDFT